MSWGNPTPMRDIKLAHHRAQARARAEVAAVVRDVQDLIDQAAAPGCYPSVRRARLDQARTLLDGLLP